MIMVVAAVMVVANSVTNIGGSSSVIGTSNVSSGNRRRAELCCCRERLLRLDVGQVRTFAAEFGSIVCGEECCAAAPKVIIKVQ